MRKFVMLFLAVSAVMMSSCSKDDNKSASLEGTWESVKAVSKVTVNEKTTVREDIADFKNCDGVRTEVTKTQIISTGREKNSDDSCNEKKKTSNYIYEGNKIIVTNQDEKEIYEVIKLTDSELVLFDKEERTNQEEDGSTTNYIYESTYYFKRIK